MDTSSDTVSTITIPYSGLIPGGIHPGIDVVINGRVPHHCNTFSVNLCVGPTYNQDCALHLNPRFSQRQVVRNHMQGGQWGPEETSGGFHFQKGHGFELHMKVTPKGYKVSVNGHHVCEFHHRLPKASVQYIYIEGDVLVHDITFRGKDHHHHRQHHPHQPQGPFVAPIPQPAYPTGQAYPPAPVPQYPAGGAYPPAPGFAPAPGYPAAAPGYPAPAPGYPAAAGPIFNPPMPFTGAIPGGIAPGKIVCIQGNPRPNFNRFTINLLAGPSLDSCDAFLHFDVRANERKIVRNHKANGAWGPEETALSFFPFNPGQPFEVMILCEPSAFKIAVNGQHLTEFYSRMQPLTRVSHVSVTGDATLTQVRFQ